jgi:hypothetical protein
MILAVQPLGGDGGLKFLRDWRLIFYPAQKDDLAGYKQRLLDARYPSRLANDGQQKVGCLQK